MLAARGYKTKKELKAAINTPFRYTETSIFGPEFKYSSQLTIVGPSALERKWYAIVTVNEQGQLTSVK